MKKLFFSIFFLPLLLFGQESNRGIQLFLTGHDTTTYVEELQVYSRYFKISKNMSFLAFDYIFEDSMFVSEVKDFKRYKEWRKKSLKDKIHANKWDKNFDGKIVNYFSSHFKDENQTFIVFVWVLNTGQAVGVISTSYNPKFMVE